MITLENIGEELKKLPSILIFCHIRPDGDTLGSASSLCLALRKMGKKCDIVCDSPIPDKFDFAKIFQQIMLPTAVTERYAGHIAVDVASENMLGSAWGIYMSSEKRMCVDHHVSNTRYAPMSYIHDSASNTINIAKLINVLGVEIDKEIASGILLGIITDTGDFAHSNTDKEALECAGSMVGFGANITRIVNLMFKNQSRERAKLYIRVMNGMRFYLEDRLALIITSLADLEATGAKPEVTEGFVDFPLSICGVEVAVAIMETKDKMYKVSFRSKDSADVNVIAATFGGGGHIRASGCMIAGYLEEVIEKIVRAVDVNT